MKIWHFTLLESTSICKFHVSKIIRLHVTSLLCTGFPVAWVKNYSSVGKLQVFDTELAIAKRERRKGKGGGRGGESA